jgi:signal transduction histidine kinase
VVATDPNSSSHDPRSPKVGGADNLRVDETVAALRALRYGTMDEATRSIALPPSVRASVSPTISALRWGAVGYGLVLSAPAAFDGSYAAVVTLAVCLFITTWRTIIPIRLGSDTAGERLAAYGDVAVLAFATGFSGGLESPFIVSVMIALIVVAFGWGYLDGALAMAIGVGSMLGGVVLGSTALNEQLNDQRDLTICLTVILAVLTAAAVRSRLVESERRRIALAGQVESLSEANGLLTLVNSVARTLPTSLTLREALHTAQRQIADTFDARVVCLLTLDENAEEWVPKLAEGCVLHTAYRSEKLPEPLASALRRDEPLLRSDLEEVDPANRLSEQSGSGIYVRLDTRDVTIGLLGLEHPELAHFDERDIRVLVGLAEVLALTIDNARWFGRLRSLGAEEERIRLARDLHDRLGQWLTYIGFELERIMATDSARVEDLDRLHHDVQAALDELRETLRQLRSGVTETQPFSEVARDVVNRFGERSDLDARLVVLHPDRRLPVPVENELLRILQEALNNVAKHAKAESVEVVWNVDGANFELTIADDGRGFETARGVRDSAYGLVGMRERADVVGAHLIIDSRPGAGTTIRVVAGIAASRSTTRPSLPMGRS